MYARLKRKAVPGKPPKTKTINVDLIARVEGEGALNITVKDGIVEDVHLQIFEPPRFFEAFLQGRHFSEVPDIVARICGICPVAYQMSAVHALESIFDATVNGTLRDLRRLLYCAEWIESHTLHIYMLHGPDFLGFDSGIEMAKKYPQIVKRGLRLKKAGNDLLALLGGRSVHPVSVKVGGFTKVPSKAELAKIKEDLSWARDAAIDTVRWVAGFDFQDPEQDYTFVSLCSSTEYPMNEGRIGSSMGLDISANEFEQHFLENQVSYSHAMQCTLNGTSYFVGPLARLHLNHAQLPSVAKQAMEAKELRLPFKRASMSIVARAVEVLFAVDEALRIIEHYEPPPEPAVPIIIKPGIGMAATEAPRGILYHRYHVQEDGSIQEAKIVPPTSQNQRRIEEDLRAFLPEVLHLSNKEAASGCEKIIRSYDPCISCATHFLKLNIEHVG